MSAYPVKSKITEGKLDTLLPTDDPDADERVKEFRPLGDGRLNRVNSFIRCMWALTTTSLAVYRGGHGLTNRVCEGSGSSSQGDEPEYGDGLPTISQGVTGGAAQGIMRKRLHAL